MVGKDAFVAVARFGLGARPGDLEIAAHAGPRDWVIGQLLHPDPTVDARLADLGSSSDQVLALAATRGADEQVRKDFKEEERDRFVSEQAIHLVAAATTATPFFERLVAFWSNHLTVSIGRKEVAPVAGAYEREVIRPHLSGTFVDLVLASAKSPAMLLYLDNAKSVGPNSSAGRRRDKGLNENYARELMELHTLGVGGGYGQADVEALARLLTGWTLDVKPETSGMMSTMYGSGPGTGGFTFRPERHEPGSQTILGRSYDDAALAIRDLATHPATAHHVATKLVRHFVSDDPPPGAVEKVAKAFLDSGGSLPATHRAVVDLDEAWKDPLTKVKSPWELVVSTGRALGPDVAQRGTDLLKSLKRMGQVPYDAPSPQGWPDRAEDWLTPGSMIARLDWATDVGRKLGGVDALTVADRTLGPVLSKTTRDAIHGARTSGEALALLLVSPEFQRR